MVETINKQGVANKKEVPPKELSSGKRVNKMLYFVVAVLLVMVLGLGSYIVYYRYLDLDPSVDEESAEDESERTEDTDSGNTEEDEMDEGVGDGNGDDGQTEESNDVSNIDKEFNFLTKTFECEFSGGENILTVKYPEVAQLVDKTSTSASWNCMFDINYNNGTLSFVYHGGAEGYQPTSLMYDYRVVKESGDSSVIRNPLSWNGSSFVTTYGVKMDGDKCQYGGPSLILSERKVCLDPEYLPSHAASSFSVTITDEMELMEDHLETMKVFDAVVRNTIME